MKENRLGPRQWAFVVVAGGTVFSLPFVQRQPGREPEPPAIDVSAALVPEVTAPVHAVAATAAAHPSASANTALMEPAKPAWPALAHSPFDELVQQKAVVPDAKPTEEIVPMHPLRPWISAPNLKNSRPQSSVAQSNIAQSNIAQSNIAQSNIFSDSDRLAPIVANPTQGKLVDSVASASPWRDDAHDSDAVTQSSGTANGSVSNQVVTSFGHGRKQLPVNAGPADQYTAEEIAEKLRLPPPSPADSRFANATGSDHLISAIVPPDQVLPVPPLPTSQPGSPVAAAVPAPARSSVVLSRQPATRPLGAPVRFGQANASTTFTAPPPSSDMVPLPPLPEERRGHIITQPKRP